MKLIHREKTGTASSGKVYFWAGFLIPALLALLGYIVIKVWPFGDGTVLIIDSLHQYLPFYTDFHEKLRSGQSLFYSFSGGFGFDFWATYAYYLASPLNFLIVLVPKANVCDFMDYIILLKIGLTGGIFSWYLHKRDPRQRFLPVVFATMYTMGNFIIGYYFNLMWLDSIAMLPLIMYGIEKIVRGGSGRVYGLSLFYALWCNYYIGFMLCIFSCLYLLVAFSERRGLTLRRFLKRGVCFGWYSLLAGGASAVVLLPAYLSLTSSEAMQHTRGPGAFKFYTDFIEMMTAHFAAEHPLNISSSQAGFNAYCGVAVLMLVICWLLDERIPLRKMLGRFLLTVFLLLSVSVNYLNFMWHGFHLQNGLPNRFAFLYVCMLLVICYDVCRDLPRMAPWKIVVAGVLPIAFSVWVIMSGGTSEDYGNWNYLTPALLAVYTVLILVLRLCRTRRNVFSAVLGAVLFAEAAAHGIYGYIYNENVPRKIYLKDQASYRNLVESRADTDFFRSEYDSQRMRNVAIYAGATSMVLFNSTMQESVTQFCDRLGIEARTNKNGYNGVTRLMNDVFGIRYVLSSIGKGDAIYQFPKIDDDGNLSLYRNDHALSVGFLVNPEIEEWEPWEADPIGVQNEFIELATGLDGIYERSAVLQAKSDSPIWIIVDPGTQKYLYLPDRVEKITLDTPEYNRSIATYNDHLYVINRLGDDSDTEVTLKLRSGLETQTMYEYTCTDADYNRVYEALARCQMTDVSLRGNRLSGAIDADRDGCLFLTVPYDEDWTVRVDGVKTEPVLLGEAMTGLELTAGHHEIQMTYVPAGFTAGLTLTLLCAALFIATAVLEEKRRKAIAGTASEKSSETSSEKKEEDQMNNEICQALCGAAGTRNVLTDEPMSRHTTFRIGGNADYFVQPATVKALEDVLEVCREYALSYYVVGNGSNLLVGDKGYRGVIIQLGRAMNAVAIEDTKIRAQAGAMLVTVSKQAAAASLTGLEFASGIPGTIGGAIVMNAGAYGGEMKQVVTQVTVLTPEGRVLTVPADEMEFGYRTSRVVRENWIVLEVTLELAHGDGESIAAAMEELKEKRTAKQPLDLPSAGSTFKRPEGYFAGKLIMDAGLAGYKCGGAQVSPKHCGFVVNTGGATAADVIRLMRHVQDRVMETDGVWLEPEVKFIGEF